jgi:purine-nucleoside phosphorylase
MPQPAAVYQTAAKMLKRPNHRYHSKVFSAIDHLLASLNCNGQQPRLALILGSGFGAFAESLSSPVRVPYSTIPHFPKSSVAGHSGNVVFGKLGKTPILCLQGRIHYYEGHDMTTVTFPVRVLGLMGIRRLILTNAAGGIHARFRPGDLMLIRDHISSFVPNPLIGPNDERFGPRFPDMSEAYSLRLRRMARRCAARLKLRLREGVYVSVTGPSYESPAEVRMLKQAGADAVGMSTVPEVIVARHMGLECLGISSITNAAAGISKKPLSHLEVLEAGERVKPRLIKLLSSICSEMARLD